MSDTTKIRIALQMARELEFEVEDAAAAVGAIEQAMADDGDLVWIVDAKGNSHGVAVGKIAFLEVEAEAKHDGVGFRIG
jgi:2-polyprenyl-3-methyl-5-hydroxy-6-metoxy-1,4-benzoquinol methylase